MILVLLASGKDKLSRSRPKRAISPRLHVSSASFRGPCLSQVTWKGGLPASVSPDPTLVDSNGKVSSRMPKRRVQNGRELDLPRGRGGHIAKRGSAEPDMQEDAECMIIGGARRVYRRAVFRQTLNKTPHFDQSETAKALCSGPNGRGPFRFRARTDLPAVRPRWCAARGTDFGRRTRPLACASPDCSCLTGVASK